MSASLEIGDVKALSWTTTAGATVVLTVTLPDGTTATPTVTPTGGNFAASYAPTQNGLHGFRWVATGAATAAESGTFQVGGIISLAEAKLQLNKAGTADDDELQAFCDAIIAPIEHECGPVVPRQVTEWHHATGTSVLLRKVPVASVTEVTEYQGATAFAYTAVSDPTAAGSYTYLLEREQGRITRLRSGGWGQPFTGSVKVTYTVGRLTVPTAINLAARLMVQGLWRTQRGAVGPAVLDDMQVQAAAFETVRSPRVQALLANYRRARTSGVG